jgi:uncharacterized protein (DUF1015 family)
MHINPFQAIFPNLDFITSPDSFFGAVREEYPEYFENGFFSKTSQEAMFLYRIETPQRSFTGLIACADIRDYRDGLIRKHEHTLSAREQQQIQLTLSRKAAIKPVLLAYPRVEAISEWVRLFIHGQSPFMEINFEEDRQRHQIWEVKDGRSIQQIRQLFEKEVPHAYIADGHHRAATTSLLHERVHDSSSAGRYATLLCAFFPSDELEVHDYNRVVEGLNEISLTTFMAKMSQLFEIEIMKKPEKPRCKHEMAMFVNREWFRLQWREHILEHFRNEEVILDTTLLNEKVLQDVFGIEDVRSDLRIEYIEGPRGIRAVAKRTLRSDHCVGFCLYPVSLDDLMKLADAGKALPPKSTWFEPRMRNGVIVQGYQ